SLGLVQRHISETLGALQQLAIHADVILRWIGLGAEFGDDLPIDLHVAGGDQSFGFAARCHSGSSNNFLQTFGWHEWLLRFGAGWRFGFFVTIREFGNTFGFGRIMLRGFTLGSVRL